MTISSTTNRKTFAGNGATTSFATSPVVFFDSADLTVYVTVDATGVATTLTENTHYTVSGGDGSTGTVDLSGGSAPHGAVASGSTLVVVRELSPVQAVDFLNNDVSDAEVIEDALDKLTLMVQQVSNRLDRQIRQPDSDIDDISELPIAGLRASKYLAFDADGDLVPTSGTTSVIVATPFAETLLDDATAADARATLGLTVGTNVQAYDAELAALAGLTSAADSVPYFTGSGTASLATVTSFARTVLDDTTAAAARTTLGASAGVTLGTPVASTSGTAIDFTSIPAGTKRITVNFKGVSTNGTSNLLVQIGDSGGIEATGYLGSSRDSASGANFTTGFGVAVASASAVLHGRFILELESSAGFTWTATGTLSRSDNTELYNSAGSKSLSAELDRVRITTVNGTDAFDAGEINISYE